MRKRFFRILFKKFLCFFNCFFDFVSSKSHNYHADALHDYVESDDVSKGDHGDYRVHNGEDTCKDGKYAADYCEDSHAFGFFHTFAAGNDCVDSVCDDNNTCKVSKDCIGHNSGNGVKKNDSAADGDDDSEDALPDIFFAAECTDNGFYAIDKNKCAEYPADAKEYSERHCEGHKAKNNGKDA